MKTEEARKLFDKDKFEEITEEEYYDIDNNGEFWVHCEDGNLYYKPKQKYPVVLNDRSYEITVHGDGSIEIFEKDGREIKYFDESLKLLYNAVEISKKIRDVTKR